MNFQYALRHDVSQKQICGAVIIVISVFITKTPSLIQFYIPDDVCPPGM